MTIIHDVNNPLNASRWTVSDRYSESPDVSLNDSSWPILPSADDCHRESERGPCTQPDPRPMIAGVASAIIAILILISADSPYWSGSLSVAVTWAVRGCL